MSFPDVPLRVPTSRWRLARQEFAVAVSNPEALILFAVFLPQFLDEGADHVAVPLLLLGTAYIGVGFCCAVGYAAVGGRLRSLGTSRATRRLLDSLAGVVLVGLAGGLAGWRAGDGAPVGTRGARPPTPLAYGRASDRRVRTSRCAYTAKASAVTR